MARQLRILLITRHFPPEPSNTASLLGELAEDLACSDTVEVVAGSPGAEASASAPPGVRLTVLAPARVQGRPARAARVADYGSFAARALAAGVAAPRPDVVVTMNEPPTAGVVGALVAAAHRCPLVVICHDLYPEITIALDPRRDGVGTGVWRLVNRFVDRRASSIVVVGRDMLERLAARGVPREKLEFVPAWASRQETNAETVRRLRSDHDWEGRFIVMHAGAVSTATDLELCVDAAGRLQDLPEVRFVFLGGGPRKRALTEVVASRRLTNVEFLPPLPKAQAQALMAAADLHLIALVPGMWGCGAPSKAYGIMAAGRPFVAAVDPGSEPARIAEEFACGFVVPAGSGAALADTIRTATGVSLEAMGVRASAGFLASYERSIATAALRGALERAVERRGSGPLT
jgi:colanic acid biosynthesis glycosyl transferase WcaI